MLTKEFYTVLQEIESLLQETLNFACCLQTISEFSIHTSVSSGCGVTVESLGWLVSHHANDLFSNIGMIQDRLHDAMRSLAEEVRP